MVIYDNTVVMWQDVFAVDSRVCEARFDSMSAEKKRDLKPLYLKRRLQLLQASHHHGKTIQSDTENHKEDDKTVSDENAMKDVNADYITSEAYQPVMRNKRYISLRVKLLKRQFGLPADVLSLKSLSLSSPVGPQPPTPFRFNDPDLLNENMDDVEMNIPSEKHLKSDHHKLTKKSLNTSSVTDEGEWHSFNRVHLILDSLHRSQVTRIMFTRMQMTNIQDAMKSDPEVRFCIVSSSLDGKISIASLESENGDLSSSILPHPGNFKRCLRTSSDNIFMVGWAMFTL